MSIYMTVFKCICMHEYMYTCMYCILIYVVCACIYVYMHACMYISMHVCIHVCIYVIFKLGFERYGGIVLVGRGNCPGELSGEFSGGSVQGKLSGGNVRSPNGAPFKRC